MNADKLEALRALAADPRTPENEARNAALTYVRGGGRADAPTARLSGPSVEVLQRQLAEMEEDRDRWRKRTHEAQVYLARVVDLGGEIRRKYDAADEPRTAPRQAPPNWTGKDPFQEIFDVMYGKKRPPL